MAALTPQRAIGEVSDLAVDGRDGEPRWVYVIDHDRRRFAVEPIAVKGVRRLAGRVWTAASDDRRALSFGSVPVTETPAIGDLVGRIKEQWPGFVQFDFRAVLSAR